MIGKQKKHQQQCEENILVTYHQNMFNLINTVYNRINKQYATVYIVNKNNQPTFNKNSKNIPPKNISIKWIYLKQFNQDVQMECIKYSYWYHYCDQKCYQRQIQKIKQNKNMKIIYIKTLAETDALFQRTTKMLHLDFIWLGVSGRLGASIQDFYLNVMKVQNFRAIQIDYINEFLSYLDIQLTEQKFKKTSLKKQLSQKLLPNSHRNNQLTEQTLQKIPQNQQQYSQYLHKTFEKCSKQTIKKQQQIQKDISNYICQHYNTCMLITKLSYHNYYLLLKTRNYFKSIWIQQSPIKRYQKFIQQIDNFKNVKFWIQYNISNFLLLDEYFYQKHLQKIAHSSDFNINTGIQKHDYTPIIASQFQHNLEYYKQIFRKFRPSFDQYFISICQILKIRGGCIKQAVGCVIVKNKRILSTGYNGTPIGSINCYNGGCEVCSNSSIINTIVLSCKCLHAQYSCIIEAGIQITNDSTLYTTQLPCLWCAKIICQAKIKKVVFRKADYLHLYQDSQKVLDIFKIANINYQQFSWGQHKYSSI